VDETGGGVSLAFQGFARAGSYKPKANLQFFDDLNFDEPIFG
jgi:hypothetical protein